MRIDESRLREAVRAYEAVYEEPKASTEDAAWAVVKAYWPGLERTGFEEVMRGSEAITTTVDEIYDLSCYGWDEDTEAFVRLMIPLLNRAF